MHYRKFGEWTNTVASAVQLEAGEQFVGLSLITANAKDFSVQVQNQNLGTASSLLISEYPGKNYIDLTAITETSLQAIFTSAEGSYLYGFLWTYTTSTGAIKEIYVTPNNLVGDSGLVSDADLVRIPHRDNKHYVSCEYGTVYTITANLPVYTNGTVFEVLNTNNVTNHHFSISALGKYAKDGDFFYVRVGQAVEGVRCYGVDTTFEGVVSYPLEEGTIYGFQYQDRLNTYKLVHRHKY